MVRAFACCGLTTAEVLTDGMRCEKAGYLPHRQRRAYHTLIDLSCDLLGSCAYLSFPCLSFCSNLIFQSSNFFAALDDEA